MNKKYITRFRFEVYRILIKALAFIVPFISGLTMVIVGYYATHEFWTTFLYFLGGFSIVISLVSIPFISMDLEPRRMMKMRYEIIEDDNEQEH